MDTNQPEKKRKNESDDASPSKKIKTTEGGAQQVWPKKVKPTPFPHGNYHQYYGYRNKGLTSDPRISVLLPEWFNGRTCLDIGCNSGEFTLDIAISFSIRHITGVDIDNFLVKKARGNIHHYVSLLKQNYPPPAKMEIDEEHNEKQETTGDTIMGETNESGPKAEQKNTREPKQVPPALQTKIPPNCPFKNLFHHVSFEQGDFLKTPSQDKYDVILCMSVVKWIHVNQGDQAVRELFTRFYEQLNAGGILVFEPQPWSSYHMKKLSQEAREICAKLELRPDDFQRLLEEKGFQLILQKKPESSVGGFDAREIFVYKKPGVLLEPKLGSHPTPKRPNLGSAGSRRPTNQKPGFAPSQTVNKQPKADDTKSEQS